MAKYLEIMDYKNNKVKTEIDLDKLDKIQKIEIKVITGDEICKVKYKNGKEEIFDSSNSRMNSFYDYEYTLYDALTGKNLINKFLERKDSYYMGRMEE